MKDVNTVLTFLLARPVTPTTEKLRKIIFVKTVPVGIHILNIYLIYKIYSYIYAIFVWTTFFFNM